MKNLSFILLSLCISYCTSVDAQCFFKKKLKKAYTETINSDNCNVIPEFLTKPNILFDKYYGAFSNVCFVKTGDDYYLFFYLSLKFMKGQQVLENDPLIIVFKDIEPLNLYPCGDFTPARWGAIGMYYKITKDEIQLIADNDYDKVKFYFTSDEELKKSQVDEDGNRFYEFLVKSSLNVSSFQNDAACMLKR